MKDINEQEATDRFFDELSNAVGGESNIYNVVGSKAFVRDYSKVRPDAIRSIKGVADVKEEGAHVQVTFINGMTMELWNIHVPIVREIEENCGGEENLLSWRIDEQDREIIFVLHDFSKVDFNSLKQGFNVARANNAEIILNLPSGYRARIKKKQSSFLRNLLALPFSILVFLFHLFSLKGIARVFIKIAQAIHGM